MDRETQASTSLPNPASLASLQAALKCTMQSLRCLTKQISRSSHKLVALQTLKTMLMGNKRKTGLKEVYRRMCTAWDHLTSKCLLKQSTSTRLSRELIPSEVTTVIQAQIQCSFLRLSQSEVGEKS